MAKLTPRVKKHTLGSDTNLFAKELNLNPEDYKIGEVIDIAIVTIKSSDNPLVIKKLIPSPTFLISLLFTS